MKREEIKKLIIHKTQEDLDKLVESRKFYPYVRGSKDKHYNKIVWYCYGDHQNDILYVFATLSNRTYIRCLESPLKHLSIANAYFNIDTSDIETIQETAHIIFEEDLKDKINEKIN